MYQTLSILSLLATLSPSLAVPSKHLRRAAGQTCEQFTPITSGVYEVQNNAWGAIPGGQSCVKIGGKPSAGDTVAWSSTFNWGGEASAIKAYPNAQAVSKTPCKPLNEYKTMPSIFNWSVSTTTITGDVAYDAFLNPECNGPGDKHIYEVMVWLARLGKLQPIGRLIRYNIQLAGHSWTLHKGTNTQTGTEVFSFVAGDKGGIKNFQGDLMEFFNYLTRSQGVDAGLKMTTMQAGAEIGVGKGTFSVSGYGISST
ncbi:MAG: hypothetical protein Q9213_000806 [Squamulea squamosa]